MKRSISGLATLVLALGFAGQSKAGVIQLTDPSQLSASDTTAIYSGADGDYVTSPYSISAGGNTLTFSTNTGTDFERVDQGNSWTGAFSSGTKLLWDLDANNTIGGPVTVGFASGVLEAGLSVQQDHPVDTTFTATVFLDGSTNPGLTITVPVTDSGTGPGNLGFIGFRATGSDVITSIVISSTDSVNTSYNNDFAMGPVTSTTIGSVVPEPSSLALASVSSAVCLMVYGWKRRRQVSG